MSVDSQIFKEVVNVIASNAGLWFLGTGAAMATAALVSWAVAKMWFREKTRYIQSLRPFFTSEGEE